MCGIFGLWDPHGTLSFSPGEIAALVERGTDRLTHRGPDGSGVWSDNNNRLALGHRRLSIVDLSETGRQPMISADGRWVITFNGEIYNHRSIREELCRTGAGFRGTSDTEVLVEAIARWGVESTLKKSRGMFAFAAWDRVDNELTVARDRVGEKPLYIAVADGVLAFASEITALDALPDWPRSINREAVWDLLRFGYVRGDKCIYEGIVKIPPASLLKLSRDSVSRPPRDLLSRSQRYWTLPEDLPPLALADHECTNHFESLIQDSIREQLVADVPVGAFLSGGLDSSLVVSIAARISSRPLSTFTIGFSDASYDESEWARRIAGHLGSDHHEIQVSEQDLIDSIPTMTRTYDEPFADPSQVPTYLVSRFARQEVTVALTGDGGDELFCGYNRYIQFRRACEVMDKLPRAARHIIGRSLQSVPVAPLEALVKSGRRLAGA
jgi:asparagine synthase (glutamine-hydrolysing)